MDFCNLEDLSIKKIKEMCMNKPSWELVHAIENDKRKGVQDLKKRLRNRLIAEEKNKAHLESLLSNQLNLARENNAKRVAGIDEVGRGPIAGPVVSCIASLQHDFDFNRIIKLNDSKSLTNNEREKIYNELTSSSGIKYALGTSTPEEIDKLNIQNALVISMTRAYNNLNEEIDLALVDGNFVPPTLDNIGKYVPQGDQKVASIAAASIIAKVYRDRLMDDLHNKYPQYNFKSNKGYGTKEHREAIKAHGPCCVHRKSFLSGIIQEGPSISG
ncbi:ribonuclease HII [Natranaerobius trueperi]|uniref:Ribonuclease HII n=2 Tax=Natranaerobius trueperi TaxID=759412 RepID=A0A226C194_9FIRM|nr:ribonuclease HII [Natranaerobius trueperi]